MEIKAILFDLDGVIGISEYHTNSLEKKYGAKNDDIQEFFRGIFQDAVIGKANLKDILAPWLTKWNYPQSMDTYIEQWFENEKETDERFFSLIPRLQEQGIKCFLATNQEKYRSKFILNEMQIKKLMDDSFFSYKLGTKKPDAEFYNMVLANLKDKHDIKANEILFFDDKQGNVDGAIECGIKAHFYTDFDKMKEIIDMEIQNS